MTLSPSQAVELARLVSENKNVEIDPTGNAHRLADYILAAPPAPVAEEDVALMLDILRAGKPDEVWNTNGEEREGIARMIERLSADLARVTKERDEADEVIAREIKVGHLVPVVGSAVDRSAARHATATKGEG